jgi:hypothetical protein
MKTQSKLIFMGMLIVLFSGCLSSVRKKSIVRKTENRIQTSIKDYFAIDGTYDLIYDTIFMKTLYVQPIFGRFSPLEVKTLFSYQFEEPISYIWVLDTITKQVACYRPHFLSSLHYDNDYDSISTILMHKNHFEADSLFMFEWMGSQSVIYLKSATNNKLITKNLEPVSWDSAFSYYWNDLIEAHRTRIDFIIKYNR